MRQLKFRAYDKKEKRIFAAGFSIIGETTVFDVIKQYALERLNDIVVMQWTGLKDFNHSDLYEGDVIRMRGDFEEEWKKFEGWHIAMRAADSYWSLVSPDNADSIPLFSFDYRGRPEVIGCIYEIAPSKITEDA